MLEKEYIKVVYEPLNIDEKKLIRYASLVRKDPRFAEIITEHIRDFWWKYEKEVLVKKNKKTIELLFLVEMIKVNCETTEEFLEWVNYILTNSKVEKQKKKEVFFKTEPIFEKLQLKKQDPLYEKYNYFGYEMFFNKGLPREVKNLKTAPIRLKDEMKYLEVIKIKESAKNNNYNNKKLAEIFNTDETTVSNIMNKKVHKITLDFLVDKSSLLF